MDNVVGIGQWDGIYVEPIEHLWKHCIENHKSHRGITSLMATVGEHDGDVIVMWRNPAYDFLYSGNEEFAKANDATQAINNNFVAISLDSLLELYKVEIAFDLLVIDVEGMEVQVLKGFNCLRWQPKMVIIETHELNPGLAIVDNVRFINSYFAGHNYMKIYTSAINTIYVWRGS